MRANTAQFMFCLFVVAIVSCSGKQSVPSTGAPPEPTAPTESADPMIIACEAGTAQSCLVAGDARERDGDFEQAVRLYALACELEEPSGCALAGGLTAERGDSESAETYFEAGCALGDSTSCHGLGLVALGVFGEEPELEAAAAAFERGCSLGLPDSCGALADLIDAGEGAGADTERARSLREGACEAGHASSCTRLGLQALRAGEDDAGRQLLERACVTDAPDPDGCGWYGWTLWSDATADEQRARAVALLDDSCTADSAVGCMFRGVVAAKAGDDGAPLLERACELDPEQCDALRAQARSLASE